MKRPRKRTGLKIAICAAAAIFIVYLVKNYSDGPGGRIDDTAATIIIFLATGAMLAVGMIGIADDDRLGKWFWKTQKRKIKYVELHDREKYLDPRTGRLITNRSSFTFRITYDDGGREAVFRRTVKRTDRHFEMLLNRARTDPTAWDRLKLSTTVVKTKILDRSARIVETDNSMKRAALGWLIAGPEGGLLGAATGERRTYEYPRTTFRLWFQDGHTEIRTVDNDTKLWKKYMSLLED